MTFLVFSLELLDLCLKIFCFFLGFGKFLQQNLMGLLLGGEIGL
jgi:hypothetical protein